MVSKTPPYIVYEQFESGEARFNINALPNAYLPQMYMMQTGLRIWIAVYNLEEVEAAVALSAAAPQNSDLTPAFVAFDSIVLPVYSQSLSLTIPHLPAGKYCVTFGLSGEIPSLGEIHLEDIVNAHTMAMDIKCASSKPMRTCVGPDLFLAEILTQESCRKAALVQKAFSLHPEAAKDIMGHPYLTPFARKWFKLTRTYSYNFNSELDQLKMALVFEVFQSVLTHPFSRFHSLALTSLAQDLPLHTTVANAVEVSSRNALRALTQVEPRNVGGMFEFCNYFAPFKGIYGSFSVAFHLFFFCFPTFFLFFIMYIPTCFNPFQVIGFFKSLHSHPHPCLPIATRHLTHIRLSFPYPSFCIRRCHHSEPFEHCLPDD